MNECKPLDAGEPGAALCDPGVERWLVAGRGLHSSTFQLNLSRF